MTISYLQKLKTLSFWRALLCALLVLILTLIASHLRPSYATTITTKTVNDAPVAPIVVDLGDGTVVDTHTGLQWLQNAGLGGLQSWADADAWATGLSYAGHNDWRLPSALNSDGSGPCFYGGCSDSEMGHLAYIDGINSSSGPFSNLGGGYWTSTPPFPGSDYRMYTVFTTGSGNGYQAAISPQQDGQPPMLMNAWAVRGPVSLPVGNDDLASTDEGTAVTINVSANDTPVPGGAALDPASIEIISPPVNGSVVPNLNGTVTYTPTAGFSGDDSFSYLIRDFDNLPSTSATVTVTVNPLNNLPVAVDDGYSTDEDMALTVPASTGALSNDSDPDGDPLTAILVAGSANGALALNVNGSFTYTPTTNFNGADSFTYKANDGLLDSNTATVSITVNAVNDAPVADDKAVTTDEDISAPITLTGSDADGNSLTFSVVTGPASGSLSGAAPSLTYTPNANFNGADSFTYKANDGLLDSNTATVSITVNAVNDAPVANAGADQSALVGDMVTLDGSASSDVDGDPLTYSWSIISSPLGSSAALSDPTAVNPSFTLDQPGTYVAQLIVNDGATNSASDTMTITTDSSAPVADFSASPLTGQLPLTVVFTDTSTGAINSWLWDFGDTATSTGQNPSHTYTAAGIYTVTLTVTGPEGSDTQTRSSYITATTGNNHMQVYGYVDSFPAGLIGDWVVDGVSYTADGSTQFEQEYGSFASGVCVEVKYLPATNQALEIETEHDYKCAASGSQYSETYGVVDDFPPGLIGEWVVDAITYTANINTQFEQEHGPFFAGGCVEVKYIANTNTAVEVNTAKPEDCGGDDTPGKQKFYGSIEVVPGGLIGTWTIGGADFVSTIATEFEEEHGNFAPGLCAEVEYYEDNGVNIATEIKTESPYHCNGGTYTNEAYGLINSFPASLYGTWTISSTTYVASVGSTEFEEEHGSFAIGVCVKVKYYTENGVNRMAEIKTEQPEHCQGSSLLGASKLYAAIDSFPPDPHIGEWIIGGAVFTTTAATEFEPEHGSFAVGACVAAKYTTVNGDNFLIKVKTERTYKCQGSSGEEFTAYGVIEVLPPGPAITGAWQVSGIIYEVGASAHLEQEYGFFAVGAYVEIKYTISNTVRLVTKIETHVAPGAGATTRIGVLDAHDSSNDWDDWVVGGVTYTTDPAIEVGAGNQFPQVGQMVHINVYENAGTQYVTTVARARQLFLPVVLKYSEVRLWPAMVLHR